MIWSASRKGPGSRRKDDLDNARGYLAKAGSQRPSWFVIPVAEAQIDELLGNREAAINAYLKAIGLGIDDPEVIRRAVQLLSERGRFNQADELMRRLQDRGFRAADSQLPRLAALVSLQVNDRVRALDLARKAAPRRFEELSRSPLVRPDPLGRGRDDSGRARAAAPVELARGAPDAWITLVRFLAQLVARYQPRTRLSGPGANSPVNMPHSLWLNVTPSSATWLRHAPSSRWRWRKIPMTLPRCGRTRRSRLPPAQLTRRRPTCGRSSPPTTPRPMTHRGHAVWLRPYWHQAASAASHSRPCNCWVLSTRAHLTSQQPTSPSMKFAPRSRYCPFGTIATRARGHPWASANHRTRAPKPRRPGSPLPALRGRWKLVPGGRPAHEPPGQ